MPGSLSARARFMAGLLVTIAKRALPAAKRPRQDDETLIEAIMTNDLDRLNGSGAALPLAKTSTGLPWFFVALECGGLPAVAWFLDRGANPTQPDPAGRLPLETLIQRASLADDCDDHLSDCPAIAMALIAAGADPTARTLQGQSLTDLARQTGLF